MSRIHIQGPDGSWEADQARTFTIGREQTNDVVLGDPSTSRRHAEIRSLGEGWEVVDLDSASGTFVDGTRVPRAPLSGTHTVGFGEGGRAVALTVTVTGAQAPPPPAPQRPVATSAPDPALFAPTMVGTGGPGQGPGLLVRRRAGGDLRFPPHVPVRIGRDPSLEVHADDSGVSRLHAVVEPRPDGWWWVDRSTSGSFVGGERVTTFKLTEPVEISLGHPTAGYEVEVVPVVDAATAAQSLAAKERRSRRGNRGLVAAVLVAALVLVGGGVAAVLLLGQDDDPAPAAASGDPSDGGDSQLSEAELDRAKQASVFILARDADGTPIYTGSGSIISEDGLILTNAHVGQPSAPGRPIGEEDPAILEIALTSPEDDKPVDAAYRATPIVSDGVLDLAILQIDADVDGNPLSTDELDLPDPMPIGDSDALRTGDDLTALGFPALASLTLDDSLDPALTVTRGVVSTFQADQVIGSNRAQIDSDIRIGSGNSGGASIDDDGELVGINSAVITAGTDSTGAGGEFTGGSALIRPVALAQDIIDIAEQGGDPDYVSPYLDAMPEMPSGPPSDATFSSAGWSVDGQGGCQGSSTVDAPQRLRGVQPGQEIYAEYVVSGLPDGTPFGVQYVSLDAATDLGSKDDLWTFGTDQVCLTISYTVPPGLPGVNSVFVVGEDGQGVVDNPVILK